MVDFYVRTLEETVSSQWERFVDRLLHIKDWLHLCKEAYLTWTIMFSE